MDEEGHHGREHKQQLPYHQHPPQWLRTLNAILARRGVKGEESPSILIDNARHFSASNYAIAAMMLNALHLLEYHSHW